MKTNHPAKTPTEPMQTDLIAVGQLQTHDGAIAALESHNGEYRIHKDE
ncbi:MAG: hypothetical protein V1784_07410 [bacterium]